MNVQVKLWFTLILGIDKFFELVKDAEIEYEKDYRLEYERLREAKKNAEQVSRLIRIHKIRAYFLIYRKHTRSKILLILYFG